MIPPSAIAVLSLALAASAPPTRPLAAGREIRETLAGGESFLFSIEVPPQSAARVVIRQQGIDVFPTLRLTGSDLPEHGLDLTAGATGEERVFPPVAETTTTWNVLVKASLPRAPRGEFTIALEIEPADDQARAFAALRQQYQAASDTAWVGDAKSNREARVMYAAVAEAALAGDRALAAEATYQCARQQDVLGDTPGAIEWQRRALSLFRELGRADRESRVLNRLGDLSRKVGEIADSESFFEQALPKAREAGDLVAIADILNNSGLLKLSLGRFEEAIDQLEAGVPLAQQVGSANVEAALTNNIADAYARLGVYDKAIEALQRGLVVVGRLKLPRRTGRTLHTLAAVYYESGDTARAEQTITQALEVLESSGDRTYTAEARAFYARMLYANGDTERAIQALARALPLLREVNQPAGIARVLATWAEIEIERGDLDAGLAKLEEALQLNRLIASPDGAAKVLYLRALAFERQRKLDDAIQSISGAVESIEATRGAIVRSELRTSYLSTVRSYFDLYVDLLQQRGSSSAAFEMSERARARTLLDGLAESASKIRKGIDPELLARERSVQAQLNAKEIYRSQVAQRDGEKGPRVQAISRDIDGLLDQWKEIEAKVRLGSPAYWALKRPEPISVERIQKNLLDAQSALVAYHLGPKRSYAWVIDRQTVTVHQLPEIAKLDEMARRYHELLSRETDSLQLAQREALSRETAEIGRRLAAVVWRPLEARVRGKRLLIVADGGLQYVPFAALPAASGAPLLAEHEIVSLPSASVLDTIRRDSRPIPANASIAVFADPVFSKSDPRIEGTRVAEAPSPSRAGEGVYSRLRFSRREAEAIKAASPGVFEALDFDAAKQTLGSRDLRKYRILHFATHGSLDTAHPELSGLVLSLVAPNGKPVDGFLRLHEIYNLDLDADLVVLSACRTALGKEVHGEGLIGLTRGFMYGGASRVVSSIWNVDDRASALLMSRFYAAMLAKRLPPAAALREAQLSLLREARWANPHYWAAFGLQGEWK